MQHCEDLQEAWLHTPLGLSLLLCHMRLRIILALMRTIQSTKTPSGFHCQQVQLSSFSLSCFRAKAQVDCEGMVKILNTPSRWFFMWGAQKLVSLLQLKLDICTHIAQQTINPSISNSRYG